MIKKTLRAFVGIMAAAIICLCPGCSDANDKYVLTEDTFFLVMTNMQYYPQQYVGCEIEYDCFTYRLTDVNGKEYVCGVRKCSSGFGCTCGNDTIIGFLLNYDGQIPEPRNQSEDSPDKTWVHVKGVLESDSFTNITIYAYDSNGNVDKSRTEIIPFLTFNASEITLIEDWSGLNYYVTK